MNNRTKKAISLFAGAGGCSLGFKQSGFEILAAFDNNPDMVNTYNLNFGENSAKQIDLATCNFKEIRKNLGLEKGELDLIIGGPPCQGFSSAGGRSSEDSRNELLNNYAKALEEFKPKWFFMENVEGMLTTGKGNYVHDISERFVELGYSFVLEKVYSQEYGVPQRRKRVIIIGNSLGMDFSFPKVKKNADGPLFRRSINTLIDAIGDLEKEEIPEIDHIFKKESDLNLQRYKHLRPGQTMKNLPAELQHSSFKKRASRRVKDGTPSDRRGGAPSGIKRLKYDEPSLTITSAATREFIHPNKDRTLTLRECARIQTFPDNFVYYGSESSKIQQIGNAIPPHLAEVFGRHLYNIIDNTMPEQLNKVSPQLLSFKLTKASAMSPALARTQELLDRLKRVKYLQGSLF